MNNPLRQSYRIKPLSAYLKKSVKFYDIDNPLVAQIVFVILLALTFAGFILLSPYFHNIGIIYEQIGNRLLEQIDNLNNFDLNIALLNSDLYLNLVNLLATASGILILTKAISFLVSLFYGFWYYFSLTEPEMPGKKRAVLFFKRLPKIIIFNILFYMGIYVAGIAFFVVMGIISAFVPFLLFIIALVPLGIILVFKLFAFKDLLILEFNPGIFRNLKKSLDLTKGCRKNVIMNGLWPFIMGWLISYLATGFGNEMISLLIISFLDVIILMVTQRLNVLMFIDALGPES
ncbi:MAG: hypothetical protein GX957_09540 [Clostridiaceae bacterium]|nr:hypothetical protein [Clostridiaceae bacterium]